MTASIALDIEVVDHGSIVTFRPLTDAGRDWIIENLATEDSQWLGGAVAVEYRYASNIVVGAQADGLSLG